MTIGFDRPSYNVNETDMTVEVCARILDGSLERPVVVALFTSEGTATGKNNKLFNQQCIELL